MQTRTEHTSLDEDYQKSLKGFVHLLHRRIIFGCFLKELASECLSQADAWEQSFEVRGLPCEVGFTTRYSSLSGSAWLVADGVSSECCFLVNTRMGYELMPEATKRNLLYASQKEKLSYGFSKASLKDGVFVVDGWSPSIRLALDH